MEVEISHLSIVLLLSNIPSVWNSEEKRICVLLVMLLIAREGVEAPSFDAKHCQYKQSKGRNASQGC